jgi:outer membrane lipoprotein-sorting protein
MDALFTGCRAGRPGRIRCGLSRTLAAYAFSPEGDVMRNLSLCLAVGCLLVGFTLAVQAGEDDKASRAIVEKAIKAHGGRENLEKAKTSQVKFSGTLDFMAGVKFDSEIFTQDSDKFKNIVEININNMDLRITQVFNGKDFWMKVGDMAIDFKDAKDLAELKENLYQERLTSLVALTKKGVTLSPLGEVKVNEEDAVGVRASSKGHRDMNLYFSKKTGMLLKTEARVFDLQTKQEVTQEKLYYDYKETGGVMMPRRITIYQDGKRHISLDISSVTYTERHDDSVFAKP